MTVELGGLRAQHLSLEEMALRCFLAYHEAAHFAALADDRSDETRYGFMSVCIRVNGKGSGEALSRPGANGWVTGSTSDASYPEFFIGAAGCALDNLLAGTFSKEHSDWTDITKNWDAAVRDARRDAQFGAPYDLYLGRLTHALASPSFVVEEAEEWLRLNWRVVDWVAVNLLLHAKAGGAVSMDICEELGAKTKRYLNGLEELPATNRTRSPEEVIARLPEVIAARRSLVRPIPR
jgi:hypothetical protein